MTLEDILLNIETDLLLKVSTPDKKSYVLLYALAQKPRVLPPADVVQERWRNIADLSRSAFGRLDCSIIGMNGKMVLQAQASHISWSSGSVPFIFVEESEVKLEDLHPTAKAIATS